jgi:hypothetical protein
MLVDAFIQSLLHVPQNVRDLIISLDARRGRAPTLSSRCSKSRR